MTEKKKRAGSQSDDPVAELLREQALRKKSYREQALTILPHVCARCGKEFSGKNLRELTVHHKDHDHMNNPPDGSNWELLCHWCHDDEHQKRRKEGYYGGIASEADLGPPLSFRPFEGLGKLIEKEGDDEGKP